MTSEEAADQSAALPADPVDSALAQWAVVRPDLDTSPMSVIGRLSRAARVVELAQQPPLRNNGLLPGEFDVLATLYRAGAPHQLTPTELARHAMVSSGAVTNRLDRLVAKGLTTRELNPNNRRSMVVTLTEEGVANVERTVVEHLANEERILAGLTADERDTLTDLLRKLYSSATAAAPEE